MVSRMFTAMLPNIGRGMRYGGVAGGLGGSVYGAQSGAGMLYQPADGQDRRLEAAAKRGWCVSKNGLYGWGGGALLGASAGAFRFVFPFIVTAGAGLKAAYSAKEYFRSKN